ncbi:hypothetical protein KFK14_14220 [Sphingobium phenoxybenzoativorans]|uniref:LPXTG cell wall anchor domain-containing protein n=1 Tax=Sphingobium phenoxybenzoativorans TaxID=1592790 RepID=A0A975Q0E8_9SPHN|nr:hypothetical protein [Sphingobium phenoxybenzoativorans]QUT04242.1 hypothetical protein KFK14_14220 [Sphingobium phenoxybenzoativorans]
MTDDKKIAAGEAAPPKDTPAKSAENSPPSAGNKTLWMGTAVGIGSAAIVAALLYTRRQK